MSQQEARNNPVTRALRMGQREACSNQVPRTQGMSER